MSTSETLAAIRAERRTRLSAIVVGILVAVLLGSVHWLGLFVGGAIAGLAQRRITSGVVAGALVGLGSWFVFLATLHLDAAMLPALRAMPIVAVSFALAVGYGALGGLVRGVG